MGSCPIWLCRCVVNVFSLIYYATPTSESAPTQPIASVWVPTHQLGEQTIASIWVLSHPMDMFYGCALLHTRSLHVRADISYPLCSNEYNH